MAIWHREDAEPHGGNRPVDRGGRPLGPNTRRYVQPRLAEGQTKTEAIRCLKR
jgi:hypothetical protein